MSIKKQLGKRIQEIRKSKNMTQEQVAELINIETVSLSNIENGRYFPSAETLDKILSSLNIKPSEIFDCDENLENDQLVNELADAMHENYKLTKLLYKFYKTIKYIKL